MRLPGLDLPVPDHTTFSRRSANLDVASALAKADGPITVVIDSTGLKVFGEGEWHLKKHGGPARRSWRKLLLAVDPDSGEILASDLTSNAEGGAMVGSAPPSASHIQLVTERGRRGGRRAVQYDRRSLGEVAMMRCKQLIGRSLRARSLSTQKVEAALGCKVTDMMTSLGMPATRKVA